MNKILGYKVHKSAYISWFSLIDADEVKMGPKAIISAGNVIKGLKRIEMGESSYIGTLNWISAFPLGERSLHFKSDPQRSTSLKLERHAAVTSRHIIDCTDSVTIGEFATIAGYRSQILTHSIDLHDSKQRCKPITIGKYCFIGTSVVILPGSKIPDYSVLAAQSIWNKKEEIPWRLYAGVPAIAKGGIDRSDAYFTREHGFVE
ncbi:acyltransferase [Telmatobacter bradus]|uniref:acyltransferase n=1 Tax=Telmatobacter bradus TaxID=474953 RepID=UPI003B4342F6